MSANHRSYRGRSSPDGRDLADAEHRSYYKGQIVFNSQQANSRAFQVASGEVIIVRNGNMVDIVEAGEILDPSIWQHAVGIAWKNCRLIRTS